MIKNELKQMCLPRLIELCESAGLSDLQKNVIIERCNKGKDVYFTSVKVGVCETKVKQCFKIALARIEDYRNFLLQNNNKLAIKEGGNIYEE